ncbi:MAG: biopolymer transporter ExbD [Gammaproteobacteria bacterium]|nr:biopolymer transporter ExbD [Gammaproteobacteria bacterium]
MKQSARARRLARHKRRWGGASTINLVSLMDIFTILVFFLMVNSGDVQVLQSNKQIKLPESVAETPPTETLLISVTASDIMVQGRAVTSLAAFTAGDTLIDEPLLAELRHQAGRRPPLAEAERPLGRPVTIMGDAALPYAVLKRLMATCGASEYRNIQLAVMKAATPMSGAATGPMAGADAPAAGGAHGG